MAKHLEDSTWIGVSQSNRLRNALWPDYVKVDERKLEELMAYAVEFAQLVRLYDENGHVAANWGQMFRNDISFFLATVICTDMRPYERRRHSILYNLSTNKNVGNLKAELRNLFKLTLDLAHLLNDWYGELLHTSDRLSQTTSDIELEIENVIRQRLKKNLNIVKAYDLGAAKTSFIGKEIGMDYQNFLPIWGLYEEEKILVFEEGKTAQQSIQTAAKQIRLLYRTFYNAIVYIINRTPRHLKNSLKDKNNHQPGPALFIAFLQLFSHAQNELNTFTKKHLDFFYYEILKQRPNKAIPDKLYAFFEISPKEQHHFIAEGTLLTAGKDEEGQDVIYRLDHDIDVSAVSIVDLRTLYFGRNKAINIGSSYQLITNIYAAQKANSRDGLGSPFLRKDQKNWALFGEDQSDKTRDKWNMEAARLGFAIAAPILHLTEGSRKVQLVFQFDPLSINTLYRIIKDISKNEKISRKDTIIRTLQDSLELEVSTEDGWFRLPSYEITVPEEEELSEFNINFEMHASDPAIVDYDPAIFGNELDTNWPTVKITLRSEDTIYAYSFLRDLVTQTIYIHVDVKGVKGLDIYNDFGRLDSTLPFQPFGPAPKLGSYFLVGKNELFRKELTNLHFDVEWHNLPALENGFTEYFRAYEAQVTSDDFLVSLSALSENSFSPKERAGQQLFNLFKTEEEGKLKEKTHFVPIDIKRLDIKPQNDLEEVENFDNDTKSGFFRFELAAPVIAFGHGIYPKLFAEVAFENAKPRKLGWYKTSSLPMLEVPRQPFIPSIRSLKLDYTSSARINVLPVRAIEKHMDSPGEVFHLRPFDSKVVFKGNKGDDRHLLPQFEHHAYLYIGLKDVIPPQALNFLFKLKESKLADTSHQRPEFRWWYMEDKQWSEILKEEILLDTTDNFSSTGIISLKLPAKFTKGHQGFDPNLYWLRVTAFGNTGIIPHVSQINLHMVSATWQPQEELVNPFHQNGILPANTIEGLLEGRKEIRRVVQPYPSFGGKPKENVKQFYTRVSERLRHKNRAITSWDYERMVLEKFSDIFQVKCIQHQENEDAVPQGTIVIVVVPKIDIQQKNIQKAIFKTLQEIKDYLQNYTSPFINIQVRNPNYERLKISSGVVFEKGKNNGKYVAKLNRDIQEFVCPWLYSSNTELQIGGSLNKNTLLNFVQNLPYVKFVTRFSVVQVINDEGVFSYKDTAKDQSYTPILTASKPWAVLVPLENHPIVFLDKEAYQNPDPAAINTMILGTDFIIKKAAQIAKEKEALEQEQLSHQQRLLPSAKTKQKRFFLSIKPRKT